MARWTEETLTRKSEEFEAIAARYRGKTLQGLEAEYYYWRKEKDRLDAELKPVRQELLVLESLIAEKMAEDELKTISFDNGNRISVRFDRPVTIADKEEFIAWLKGSGREFELTVYANSVKRIVREYQEEEYAIGLPPGVVEGEPQPVLTYTRRK